jgi:basic amino acid/polyamine antiporter, APA family
MHRISFPQTYPISEFDASRNPFTPNLERIRRIGYHRASCRNPFTTRLAIDRNSERGRFVPASRDRVLQRIIGAPTALFIGLGVAIGSGIFRTPGIVAAHLHEPRMVLLAWCFGGAFVLMAGMVTAELATRFPRAGGEYVFLREAYGEFVAFFFGWAYTIFIIGGGAASIAAALGEFGCEILSIDGQWSGALAASAIVLVTVINTLGLKTGATTQNILTIAKIVALIAIIVIGFAYGRSDTGPVPIVPAVPATSQPGTWIMLTAFLAGVIPILWAFDGTTDSVKMAEEVKDVRRALPRALIGSALALTGLYLMVNIALMRLVPLNEMANYDSVPSEAMRRAFGATGQRVMLAMAIIICLGSLSSTVLATIRVTFALARDGLTFRFMGRMSKAQSPVGALIVVGAFSVVLVLNRQFTEVLNIYFFASSILFGLSYASLIVFRFRETEFPTSAFRCPAGIVQSIVLILIQFALAARIVAIWIETGNTHDAIGSIGLMMILGAMYFVWKANSTTTNTGRRS